jgi:hypothetical protein
MGYALWTIISDVQIVLNVQIITPMADLCPAIHGDDSDDGRLVLIMDCERLLIFSLEV